MLLATAFGLALAFADQGTARLIAENRQRQICVLAQRAILGGSIDVPKVKPAVSIRLKDLGAGPGGVRVYEVVAPDGPETRTLGYAVVADGIGWDRLRLVIGVSSDFHRITGLEILDCRETPGLGDRIRTEQFREQYSKPTSKPLELVRHKPRNNYQVQSITGATISSQAVTDMVNNAVARARRLIAAVDR